MYKTTINTWGESHQKKLEGCYAQIVSQMFSSHYPMLKKANLEISDSTLQLWLMKECLQPVNHTQRKVLHNIKRLAAARTRLCSTLKLNAQTMCVSFSPLNQHFIQPTNYWSQSHLMTRRLHYQSSVNLGLFML